VAVPPACGCAALSFGGPEEAPGRGGAAWLLRAAPPSVSFKLFFTAKARQWAYATGDFTGLVPAAAEELVEQLTVLVTSEGRWVLPGSEEFLDALGDPSPDYDAVGFAVRNLGFIKYQILDRLVTEIELHPRNVALPALVAVERTLEEPPTKLFRLKHLDTEWHSEIFASADSTVARLRELCTNATVDPGSTERFHVEPQDPNALLRDIDNPLRRLTQKWRASFGQFDSTVISFAIQHGLLARLMIAGMGEHDSDPVFRFIGADFTSLGSTFPFEGIGRPLTDLPDKDYGGWITEFYKAVAAGGQPRYDLVTAAIRTPAGPTPSPVRYERLLLPWKSGSEGVLVTLLSKKSPPISESGFAKLNGAAADPKPISEPKFAPLVGDATAPKKLVKSS
jgi:hypothetical protein